MIDVVEAEFGVDGSELSALLSEENILSLVINVEEEEAAAEKVDVDSDDEDDDVARAAVEVDLPKVVVCPLTKLLSNLGKMVLGGVSIGEEAFDKVCLCCILMCSKVRAGSCSEKCNGWIIWERECCG